MPKFANRVAEKTFCNGDVSRKASAGCSKPNCL
jgi:hypothetical protein